MTVKISDLNYKVLEAVVENLESISKMESEIINQILIAIFMDGAGNALESVLKMYLGRSELDKYKIINYIINKYNI